MIKDITIGQYYPTNSIVHKLDPRLKLLSLIVLIVTIFLTFSVTSLVFLAIFVLALIFTTKIPVLVYIKNVKSLLPIVLLTAVLNIFYITDGKVLLSWWVIKITYGGIKKAIFMAARIIFLVIISSMLTYTTTPNELTDAIEKLLSPLKYIGLGNAVHTIAMMMTIALRFIPTLLDETEKLMNAQKARGADFESGNVFKRVKALIPILIPLLISSFRRAFELSEAMESRCYSGSYKRTRLKKLQYSVRDLFAAVVVIIGLVLVILFNLDIFDILSVLR